MSASLTCFPQTVSSPVLVPPPKPVWLPPIWPGELDGRYINCIPDLGPFGDSFTAADTISIAIVRQDGEAVTVDDLQPIPERWPTTLDTTGLVVTFGLYAPLASANSSYFIVFMANPTKLGRIYVRFLAIQVVPWPGANPSLVPAQFTLLVQTGGVLITLDPTWPLDPAGLAPGSFWSNGGVVIVVPGVVPDPTAPPVIFGQITSTELLSLGGGNLPLSDPGVLNQLWNNNAVVMVSQGP
jgi:hypothetical protein